MIEVARARRFGPILRALRKKAGLTLSELGAHLGLTPAYISQVELRDKPPLEWRHIIKAAELLPKGARPLLEAAALERKEVAVDLRTASPDIIRLASAFAWSWKALTEEDIKTLWGIAHRLLEEKDDQGS